VKLPSHSSGASARPCQGTGPVPPSRFLTVLMACSARSLAGLLHPAADPGVRLVSGFSLHPCGFQPSPSSRTRAPFEAFPSLVAVRPILLGGSCPLALRLSLVDPKIFAFSFCFVLLAEFWASRGRSRGIGSTSGF
jgi:hypothetical protein